MNIKQKSKDQLLKEFMQDQFDFSSMVELGIFKKEMRNDYEAQAATICKMFGFETVYEYGAMEVRCHISYENNERPLFIDNNGNLKPEPFVTVKESIYT